MKTIYLVFENGSGAIHKCFYEKVNAEMYIAELEKQTDMNCYIIVETTVE